MNKKHLWQGTRITDEEVDNRLDNIESFTLEHIGGKFPLEYLLDKMQIFHEKLCEKGDIYESFVEKIMQIHSSNRQKAEAMLDSIVSFISKDNLQKKLYRELGTLAPFSAERPSMKEAHFESWEPLGTLVHIAPTNVFAVPVMCVIEGLLSGNINILKTSSTQVQLPQLFFETLLSFDSENLLKPYIIILEFSSKKKKLLQKVINTADAVSAWGGENAIDSLRQMTPQGVRFVEWGHKISFAYFAKGSEANDDAIEQVCRDVCLLDQNACSSPQDVFLDTEDFDELKKFAERFALILDKVSKEMPGETPSDQAQAEISTVISIAKTEEALNLTKVFQCKDFSWSVIADKRTGLSISPLFRNVIIKPLPAKDIIKTLHPMKRYLQTVGLVAKPESIIPLTRKFFASGCLRIREAGSMHDGYTGEPHDGIYALPRFMKRISILMPNELEGISTFAQFEPQIQPAIEDVPIMDKTDFQSLEISPEYAELTFKSGGSSGKTTYSYFTYEDYNIHMKVAAQGLFAAGLNPNSDRVINLFAAGHLYGGFLSFFTILEKLETPQYPMGLIEDLTEAGQLIIEKNINTVLSIPTFIMKLFRENEELFKKEKPIKKIFFGGDHFPQEQINYLKNEFGVELVKAAAYGSNDAGVLGYQCPECKTNEYHLLSDLQQLEVFAIDEDVPAEENQTGRMVFTSKHRKGQDIKRYDLGDTGFIHKDICKCGRKDPKFSLIGRSSDAFKAGGPFLNYKIFINYLEKFFNYTGIAQIHLSNENKNQKLLLLLEKTIEANEKEIKDILLQHYEYLRLSVDTLGLKFEVQKVDMPEFEVVKTSGKTRHIVDIRTSK